MAYEASLKAKWDTQNAFDYAIKKAQEEERSKAEADIEQIANLVKTNRIRKNYTQQQLAELCRISIRSVPN